jgi:outer membrane protein TolC
MHASANPKSGDTAQAKIEASDWGAFSQSSPETPSPAPMDLETVLARAREISPELQAARLEVERMTARLFGVRVKYFPEFEVKVEAPRVFDYYSREAVEGGTEFKYRTQEPGVEASVRQHLPTNTDIRALYEHDISRGGLLSDRLSLVFSQELLRKDPIWLQESLADKQIWLKKTARSAVEREFDYRVKNAFYAVLEAEVFLASAERRHSQSGKIVAESEEKYRSGAIAEYSLIDYQRDFQSAGSRLVSRRAAWERARAELATLLEVPFDRVPKLIVPDDPTIDPDLIDPARMVDSGMRNALDVAQIRFNLFANAENAEFLRNSILPSVRLEARGDLYKTIGDGVFNTADPVEGRDLSAALLVSIPLFGSTFEKLNNLRLESIDRSINETEIDSLFKQEVRTVRTTLVTLEEILSRRKITAQLETLTARGYEISRARFELGSVSSFDMIRTSNDYYAALDESASLKYNLLRTLSAIERDYPLRPPATKGVAAKK